MWESLLSEAGQHTATTLVLALRGAQAQDPPRRNGCQIESFWFQIRSDLPVSQHTSAKSSFSQFTAS